MKILLVQPQLVSEGTVEPPVGLAALAAWLCKHGHQPRILDLDLYQQLAGEVSEAACERRLTEEIRLFKPDVVGVTSMYSNSLQAGRLIAVSKRVDPTVVTIAGGCHFGALPKEALLRYPDLDFVVQGEGERAFTEFLVQLSTDRAWSEVQSLAYRAGGRIVINSSGKLADLTELPNPWALDQEVLSLAPYSHSYRSFLGGRRIAYVEAGRGCPFACSFCSTAPFWNRKYRVKTVRQVVDEIRSLHFYGYSHFVLVHDLLTLNKKYISQLSDALLHSNMAIEWMANSRTDIDLKGLLPKMKISGCWKLFFGIESASPRVQESIRKGLTDHQSLNTIRELAKDGLTSTCSFVIGFPEETVAEISASIGLGAKMKLAGAETVQFHRLRIWPPAPISQGSAFYHFDSSSLEIEYPYVDVSAQDLSEIRSDSKFFSGYFVPDSKAGSPEEIAQLEMFAHHAVALAPMTVSAMHTFRPDAIASSFLETLAIVGRLVRKTLDWDGGRLWDNWLVIKPYLQELVERMRLEPTLERPIVEGLVHYEGERTRFATAADQIEHEFVSRLDIPNLIDCLKDGRSLTQDLLRSTLILFRREDYAIVRCFSREGAVPASFRLVER